MLTIGFTNKPAERFFAALRAAGVRRVVDVRLNNTSQLAGFSKRDDLIYFLREICDIGYVHLPELAPTADVFDAYKKHGGSWEVFEHEFLSLMEKRRIDQSIARDVIDQGCLLCSEDKPHNCHRRIVAEYLTKKWGNVATEHLA
ncbi:MAG: DUF488 domain-containing protein [Phycisphaerae bacterium]|nr:DUF488 domain-containing protein [Phycisphaerae bacterium]